MNAWPANAGDVIRWMVCGAVVLSAHAGAGAVVAGWTDRILPAEPVGAIFVDLAPVAAAPSALLEDTIPGPLQEQAEARPEKPPEKAEDKVEEKIEKALPDRPPEVKSEVMTVVPRPVPKREPPKPKKPPAPATTAPPRATRTAALSAAPVEGSPSSALSAQQWAGRISAAIERHKRYPAEAKSRGEQGVTEVAFSIDRQGHLLSSKIIRSSGYAALDQETLTTLQRAQPFPPPPPTHPGVHFDFKVPIRFNIR